MAEWTKCKRCENSDRAGQVKNKAGQWVACPGRCDKGKINVGLL